MNVTDEMVTDAMNTYLHISPEGVNTAGLRAVLEQALAAQPAPVDERHAVPNDDDTSAVREMLHKHGVFIYEVDFGDEGKGRYVRLNDFTRTVAKLEAQPAPTVDAAIAAMVDALARSKGWLRDYAEAIIRDAIDRRGQPEAAGGEPVEWRVKPPGCAEYTTDAAGAANAKAQGFHVWPKLAAPVVGGDDIEIAEAALNRALLRFTERQHVDPSTGYGEYNDRDEEYHADLVSALDAVKGLHDVPPDRRNEDFDHE